MDEPKDEDSPFDSALKACAHEITAAWSDAQEKETFEIPFVRNFTVTLKIKEYHYKDGVERKIKWGLEVNAEPLKDADGEQP